MFNHKNNVKSSHLRINLFLLLSLSYNDIDLRNYFTQNPLKWFPQTAINTTDTTYTVCQFACTF